MQNEFQIAILISVAVWIVCGLAVRPVRIALGNGLRCMRRYPDLWRIPASFGITYAAFNFVAAALLIVRREEDFSEWLVALDIADPPRLSALLRGSWLSALEGTASIFSIFTATFPLSALFALLFILNVGGTLGESVRAVRKRFPGSGWLIVLLLIVSALAAVAKPGVFLFLPEIAARISLPAAISIGLMSSIFETLLGAFFLTYLMLMAYAWTRGFRLDRFKLRRLAARRLGVVVKWSLVIVLLTLLLVVLPSLLPLLLPEDAPNALAAAEFAAFWGRVVLAAILLAGCAVQATLVFHNESLRQAVRDNLNFLGKNPLPIASFLVAAAILFLAIESANHCVLMRFGYESAIGYGARAFDGLVKALLGGWLIAAWVCLYKSLTTGRKNILF